MIGRQVRQWQRAGLDPVIVSGVSEILDWARAAQVRVIQPARCSVLAETILSCAAEWDADIFWTYGDVVFSDAAIDKIRQADHGPKWFGFPGDSKRWAEIFAVWMPHYFQETMIGILKKQIADPIDDTHPIYSRFSRAFGVGKFNWRNWVTINDFTFDVDFIDIYLGIVNALEAVKDAGIF